MRPSVKSARPLQQRHSRTTVLPTLEAKYSLHYPYNLDKCYAYRKYIRDMQIKNIKRPEGTKDGFSLFQGAGSY